MGIGTSIFLVMTIRGIMSRDMCIFPIYDYQRHSNYNGAVLYITCSGCIDLRVSRVAFSICKIASKCLGNPGQPSVNI
ncbi:hypothetical protein EV127DRAFT_433599 [Xylaria flabelliformis]|nr:hypothetical protein EV127DRAFT_433599 [Xylaria flabelliformis]